MSNVGYHTLNKRIQVDLHDLILSLYEELNKTKDSKYIPGIEMALNHIKSIQALCEADMLKDLK